MEKENSFKKYDHSEAIKSQIKHCNHLISGIETEEEQDFRTYFSKCFMALSNLEAMIKPFNNEIEEEDNKYESNLDDVNPMKKSKGDLLKMLNKTMTEIFEFLYNQNLFYAQRTGRTRA